MQYSYIFSNIAHSRQEINSFAMANIKKKVALADREMSASFLILLRLLTREKAFSN